MDQHARRCARTRFHALQIGFSNAGAKAMNRVLARLFPFVAATSFFLSAFPNPIVAQTPLFNPQTQYVSGTNPSCIVVDDFNGDRVQDLAVVNFGSATVSVLLGNGDGTFRAAQTFAVGSFPWYIAEGDFNGDGRPDLVVTNHGDSTVSVLLGNGDGTFQAARTFAVGQHPGMVAVGDFNGDGIQDLVVANLMKAASQCCWATAMGPSRRQ